MGVLSGKGALVTGGSRGIGRAILKRLAADGATAAFSYLRNEAAAREVVSEVEEAGGQAFAVRATDTELLRSANPGATFTDTIALTSPRRPGLPADIAGAVAMLAGPDAARTRTGSAARTSASMAASGPDPEPCP
jgi:NAD(P)-dependent dehydrogenase (short-subunit alcohol dehydrogenase family)